ncbi:MAG: hypothetical protein IK093_09850, partial [Ruminiclostridium sp.]|nr:hypothetical protein [Ruminiclostridium sp.]
ASALASGTVDVVFWTRSNANPKYGNTEEEHAAFVEEKSRQLTEEQNELMRSMRKDSFSESTIGYDMPDETIYTDPYFADPITIVALK